MTENQEKELFTTLATLVTGVNQIQTDVQEIKETLDKHSQVLDKHSQVLDKHSQVLDKHSQSLNRLEAKTDSIAEIVINQETRISKVEKNVEDLGGGVH